MLHRKKFKLEFYLNHFLVKPIFKLSTSYFWAIKFQQRKGLDVVMYFKYLNRVGNRKSDFDKIIGHFFIHNGPFKAEILPMGVPRYVHFGNAVTSNLLSFSIFLGWRLILSAVYTISYSQRCNVPFFFILFSPAIPGENF